MHFCQHQSIAKYILYQKKICSFDLNVEILSYVISKIFFRQNVRHSKILNQPSYAPVLLQKHTGICSTSHFREDLVYFRCILGQENAFWKQIWLVQNFENFNIFLSFLRNCDSGFTYLKTIEMHFCQHQSMAKYIIY